MNNKGKCPRGGGCTFWHPKTCNFWKTNSCQKGNDCQFAHFRAPPAAPASQSVKDAKAKKKAAKAKAKAQAAAQPEKPKTEGGETPKLTRSQKRAAKKAAMALAGGDNKE